MKHYHEEDLFAYLDGDYDKGLETDLREHLENCPRCAKLYKELSVLDKQLTQIAPEEPSVYFTAAVTRKLFPVHQEETAISFNFQYLMIFGIMVAVLVFLVSMASLGFMDAILLQTAADHAIVDSSAGFIDRISSPATRAIISKGLIGTCAIMLLVVLDKVFLTPYFKKRREERMSLSR